MGHEDEDHHARDTFSHGLGLQATLAATFSLIGIILVIIILRSYVKYLQRHQQRRRRHDLIQRITTQITHTIVSFAESPNSGLDPVIIASLPKLLYKETEHFRQGEVMECSVCLVTIVEDATIRVLPNCKHVFHVDCVDMWLSSNSTCPVCRAVADPKVQPAAGHDHLATQVQVQHAAPVLVEGGSVSHDADHELEMVSCSGLRIASFPRMVISRERSLRMTHSSHGSAALEDLEKQ